MKQSKWWPPAIVAFGLAAFPLQARPQSTAVRHPAASAVRPRLRPDLTLRVAGSPKTIVDSTATPPDTSKLQPRRAAVSRARLEVLLGKSPASIRVVRATGVTNLPASADSAHIAPGEAVFRRLADTARRLPAGDTLTAIKLRIPRAGTAAVFVMPYRWLMVDAAGVERLLVPQLVLMGGGLSYDDVSRLYRGTAYVGVEDSLHPQEARVDFPQALRLQLTTTSGGSVTPVQLGIGHTSLDYDSVRIESPDSNHVRIRTGADPAGILIPIPVQTMQLGMMAQPQSLQGFGLATTAIAVSLPHGMGRLDTVTVSLNSSRGSVRPATLPVNGADGATFRLRSGFPGKDSVRAFLDGVLVGETVLDIKGPWEFLSATFFGVLLAAFARFVGARKKTPRIFVGYFLRGLPFALLAAILGALGIDLWFHDKLGDSGSWIGVLATAMLGAWVGKGIFDRILPKPAA